MGSQKRDDLATTQQQTENETEEQFQKQSSVKRNWGQYKGGILVSELKIIGF